MIFQTSFIVEINLEITIVIITNTEEINSTMLKDQVMIEENIIITEERNHTILITIEIINTTVKEDQVMNKVYLQENITKRLTNHTMREFQV